MTAKRNPAIVDAYDRGTTQTRKRLREATLTRLIREGRVDPNMERAASEIESIYFALTRRLFAKTASMERVDGGEPPTTPEWIVTAYMERYLPWVGLIDRSFKAPATSIIFDVVIDDWKLKDLDRKHRKRDGFARQVTISGLKLYADMAGWGRKDPIPLHMVPNYNI